MLLRARDAEPPCSRLLLQRADLRGQPICRHDGWPSTHSPWSGGASDVRRAGGGCPRAYYASISPRIYDDRERASADRASAQSQAQEEGKEAQGRGGRPGKGSREEVDLRVTRPWWLVHLHLIRDAVAPTTRSLMCMIEMAPSGPEKYVCRRYSDVIPNSKDMRQRGGFSAHVHVEVDARVSVSVMCDCVAEGARGHCVPDCCLFTACGQRQGDASFHLLGGSAPASSRALCTRCSPRSSVSRVHAKLRRTWPAEAPKVAPSESATPCDSRCS